MSSHHIVREHQEPALIIADGARCSYELLSQLLEWSPKILVLDGALDEALSLGIKVDVVLGDFDDSNVADVKAKVDERVEVIYAEDQNRTDLEKGIDWLLENGAEMVNVVWATGKRMDHTFNNIATLAKYPNRNIVMYDDYSRIYMLEPQFKKWFQKGQVLSLFPMGQAHGITTEGLKYNLKFESLILDERTGSSNETIEDGLVYISYESGKLLLMETYEK